MKDGLKRISSLKDQEVTERREYLDAEINRLNNRLSQFYEDKLDGVIDSAFFQKKATEGRERLADLQEQLERVQTAGEKQMELGLQILEFAKDAYPLFSRMIPSEQAKMLRIVFSKCCLKDGKLTLTCKSPSTYSPKVLKMKIITPRGIRKESIGFTAEY